MSTLLVLQLGSLWLCFSLGLAYRSELIPFKAFAVLFAIMLLICLLVSLYSAAKWLINGGGFSFASIASWVVTLGVSAWIILFIYNGIRYPSIHDITTDTNNPPAFLHVHNIRQASDNSLSYRAEVAEQQQAFYQDLTPLITTLSYDEAFARAKTVATQLAWKLEFVDQGAGVIEASQRTALFGFIDDIVIRLTKVDTGIQIDLRSVSRVGRSDLGANAARIRQFLSAY